MEIKIIAEGSTKLDHWMKKWGLSILIDGDVLFDTFGDSAILKANLEKYNIKAADIRHIIISHEHWDHTGGLWYILENNKDVTLYFCSRFSDDFRNKVKEFGCQLVEVTKSIAIKENIFTTGEIEGSYNNQSIWEQSLIIRQNNTLAVVTGCSHPGILTILTRINLLYKEKIDLLLGGLHLADKSDEELEKITIMLYSIYGINTIAAFHCTGSKAIRHFRENKKQNILKIKPGDCFTFNMELSSWEPVLKKK